MDESRLAYRIRTAVPADDAALRAGIASTLAHPDRQGKRESYRGAAERGELLLLERFDRLARAWQVAGFVEFHLRVDDLLSIRDIGTATDEPRAGVVRHLLDDLFSSYKPTSAQTKVRRDARPWLDLLTSIPGWDPEGDEYRRPHYWTILRWDRRRAEQQWQQARPLAPDARPREPRPPAPPAPPRGGWPGPAGTPRPRAAGPMPRRAPGRGKFPLGKRPPPG